MKAYSLFRRRHSFTRKLAETAARARAPTAVSPVSRETNSDCFHEVNMEQQQNRGFQ